MKKKFTNLQISRKGVLNSKLPTSNKASSSRKVKEKNLHTTLHVITQFQKLKRFEYLQLFSAYYGRTHQTLIYINKSSHFTDGNQEGKKKRFVQMKNIKGLETDI